MNLIKYKKSYEKYNFFFNVYLRLVFAFSPGSCIFGEVYYHFTTRLTGEVGKKKKKKLHVHEEGGRKAQRIGSIFIFSTRGF